jgi:hypothetical protein
MSGVKNNENLSEMGEQSNEAQQQQQLTQELTLASTPSSHSAANVTFRRVSIEQTILEKLSKTELKNICLQQAETIGYFTAVLKEDQTIGYHICENKDSFVSTMNAYEKNQGDTKAQLSNKALLFNTAWEQAAEFDRRLIRMSEEKDKLKKLVKSFETEKTQISNQLQELKIQNDKIANDNMSLSKINNEQRYEINGWKENYRQLENENTSLSKQLQNNFTNNMFGTSHNIAPSNENNYIKIEPTADRTNDKPAAIIDVDGGNNVLPTQQVVEKTRLFLDSIPKYNGGLNDKTTEWIFKVEDAADRYPRKNIVATIVSKLSGNAFQTYMN